MADVVWFRFLGQAILTSMVSISHYGFSSLKVSNPKLQLLCATMLGSMIFLNFSSLQYLQRTKTTAVHFLAIAKAFIYAFFNLLTRPMAATNHPAATQLFSGLAPAIFITPVVIFYWQTPVYAVNWIAVVSTVFFGFLGHFCLAQAYRYAKANTLSPFFYHQILYLILLGWLLFDQAPISTSSLVMLSCLQVAYIYYFKKSIIRRSYESTR
jgi:drug/metabolite transporter (DMT)-like permease